MTCPRCGTVFEGNFCPQCGTPASVPPAVAAPALGRTCPRCGAVFEGNFCPRCGLPVVGAYGPPTIMRPPESGGRSVLSVLWSLALVGFFIFIALNFAGLLLSPAYVAPGIQSIARGQSVNPDLTSGIANWTFVPVGTAGATGTYDAAGGNPGGALEMTLPPGSGVGGEWVQAVQLKGSAPWLAEAVLNYSIQTSGTVAGRLVIAVETTPTGLDLANAANETWVNVSSASTSWIAPPPADVSGSIGDSGTYYLKIAYVAAAGTGSTIVRFDNLGMAWTTDAYFYFYLPLPLPELLYLVYISQDPAQYLAYFGFIVVVILAAGAWYTWRDRKLTLKAITAPLEAIGTRLRSMSGWVAVAQVWMATMFFQYALILLLAAIGSPATSPFAETNTNAWVLLFDYSAASVYEELAFRALLIGVPMLLGALLLRVLRPRSVGVGNAPSAPGSGLLHAFRYLWGGNLRRESSREAQLAAWILILVSSLLFGLAHAPGWGWWKVLPAFVVGLGMGYVFVRHGLGAAILLHFATDGSLALSLEGVGGIGVTIISNLLFIALAVAGAGFFVWYVIYGWEEFRALWARFSSRVIRRPVAVLPGPGSPPPGFAPPPGTASVTYSVAPMSPPPPSGYTAPPPTGYAPQPGSVPPGTGWPTVPMASMPRAPNLIPRGYMPTYHPAPYGYPPVQFQCPFCGWVEAKYENRHFTCLRCGRTT